ncbi:hypothetical protein WCLP8_1160003 [uncultured Gammaproteobacteria bacterium]
MVFFADGSNGYLYVNGGTQNGTLIELTGVSNVAEVSASQIEVTTGTTVKANAAPHLTISDTTQTEAMTDVGALLTVVDDYGTQKVQVTLTSATGSSFAVGTHTNIGVSGSGPDVVVLTGTVSDLNTYFSSHNLVYTASSGTDDQIMVEVDDNYRADLGIISVTVGVDDTPITVDLGTSGVSYGAGDNGAATYSTAKIVTITGPSAAHTTVDISDSDTRIAYDVNANGSIDYSGVSDSVLVLKGYAGLLDGSFIQFDDGSLLKRAAGAGTLIGGSGADQLIASDSGSTLKGLGGDDLLIGGGGRDLIYGGTGDNTILGGGGNDTIYTGTGSGSGVSGNHNQVTGGLGNDMIIREGQTVFHYSHAANEGNDVISGFNAGTGLTSVDKIAVTGAVWTDVHTTQVNSDTYVQFANSTTVVKLVGVTATNLDAGDFIFS